MSSRTALAASLWLMSGCLFDTSPLGLPDAGKRTTNPPPPLLIDASVALPPDAALPSHDAAGADAATRMDASAPQAMRDADPVKDPADDPGNPIDAPDAAEPMPDAAPPPIDATPPELDAGPTAPLCPAGIFVGQLDCTVDPTGLTPFAVLTPIEFALSPSPQHPKTSISQSKVAFDLTGFWFEGDLSGELDCATGALRADIVNGAVTGLLLPIATPFSGAVEGQLDGPAQRFAGSWWFTTLSGQTCAGTWLASLKP